MNFKKLLRARLATVLVHEKRQHPWNLSTVRDFLTFSLARGIPAFDPPRWSERIPRVRKNWA